MLGKIATQVIIMLVLMIPPLFVFTYSIEITRAFGAIAIPLVCWTYVAVMIRVMFLFRLHILPARRDPATYLETHK